jgi:nickel-type superoxide dismutase maturation protease
MIRILAVTENSMSPEYNEGDYVVAVKFPFGFSLHPGDVVVFYHPAHGTMIKRIAAISDDGQQITVLGSLPSSIDSRNFGPIAPHSVIGKVIWHIRP